MNPIKFIKQDLAVNVAASGARRFSASEVPLRIYSAFALALLVANAVHGQSQPNIYTATLGEGGARTAEISTEELRHILTEKSATVFDVRPTVHEI